MTDTMTISREIFLDYSAFVEMFEPTKDFSDCNDDGTIILLVKDVEDTKCAFLWKPDGYKGKWMRMRYNGSSPFALWWCQMDCDDEKEENE